MTFQQALQALVFASPKPISAEELLAAIKGAGESCENAEAQAFAENGLAEVKSVMSEMQEELERSGAPFRLVEGVNGWAFVTHPDYAPWVRQLYPEAKPTRLSGPALETLAIIAYRQPVTRGDMEAVRGVAVDGVMQVLLDRGLVKISGRADLPGRPLLYSTTAYFLEHFGLKSTGDLPNSDELRRIDLPKAPSPEEKVSKKKERKMEGIEETAPLPGLAEPVVSAKGVPAQGARAVSGAEAVPGGEGSRGAGESGGTGVEPEVEAVEAEEVGGKGSEVEERGEG